jgi:hypothetical protein
MISVPFLLALSAANGATNEFWPIAMNVEPVMVTVGSMNEATVGSAPAGTTGRFLPVGEL